MFCFDFYSLSRQYGEGRVGEYHHRQHSLLPQGYICTSQLNGTWEFNHLCHCTDGTHLAMLLIGASWQCTNSVFVWLGNQDLAGTMPNLQAAPSHPVLKIETSCCTQVMPCLLAFMSRGYTRLPHLLGEMGHSGLRAWMQCLMPFGYVPRLPL